MLHLQLLRTPTIRDVFVFFEETISLNGAGNEVKTGKTYLNNKIQNIYNLSDDLQIIKKQKLNVLLTKKLQ